MNTVFANKTYKLVKNLVFKLFYDIIVIKNGFQGYFKFLIYGRFGSEKFENHNTFLVLSIKGILYEISIRL